MKIVNAIKCEKCGHLMEMPGIKKNKKAYKRANTYKRWTPEEIEYLKTTYMKRNSNHIAKALKRSKHAVIVKASLLGLKG